MGDTCHPVVCLLSYMAAVIVLRCYHCIDVPAVYDDNYVQDSDADYTGDCDNDYARD